MNHGAPPAYDNLKVFGCLAFSHKHRRGGDNFDERSRKCMFLGYSFGKKVWNMYDLETQEVFVSRDVVFVETLFSLRKEAWNVTEGDDKDLSDFGQFDDSEVIGALSLIVGKKPAKSDNEEESEPANVPAVTEAILETGTKKAGNIQVETEKAVRAESTGTGKLGPSKNRVHST